LLAVEPQEWMLSAGGSYLLKTGHTVGWSQDWAGDRAGLNPTHTVNFSYRYVEGPSTLYVTVRNIFDRKNMTPDGQYSVPLEIQQTDRANVLLGYRYTY